MDSQAVMAGTHDQNVEMNVQTTRKLRGVNSVDLNKTALRIPVPGTSALAFGCTIAAGTFWALQICKSCGQKGNFGADRILEPEDFGQFFGLHTQNDFWSERQWGGASCKRLTSDFLE